MPSTKPEPEDNPHSSISIIHKALKLVPFGISIGIALLIAGICCLCIQETITAYKEICKNQTSKKYIYKPIMSIDYSGKNCHDELDEPCFEANLTTCQCNLLLNVTELIEGDLLIAYKIEADKYFSRDGLNEVLVRQSRDNQQLNGTLNATVSEACKGYDYDENKLPIAPCGALADFMFTDSISGVYAKEILPSQNLLRPEQKIGYKNPEPKHNLSFAFNGFAKPKSWTMNVWELDNKRPENNGFENEAFITWMSDMDIKPMWRLNRTGAYEKGLPPDKYSITIDYRYPYSLYNGTRNITLYREYVQDDPPVCYNETSSTQEAASYGLGVAGVVLGFIFLVASIALVLAYKFTDLKNEKRNPSSVNNINSRNSVNHPTSDTDNHGSYSFNQPARSEPTEPSTLAFIDEGDGVEAIGTYKPIEEPRSPAKPPRKAEEVEPERKTLTEEGQNATAPKKSPRKSPKKAPTPELKPLQDNDDEEYL